MLGGAEAWLRSLGACQLWPILTDSRTRGANPACWHGHATSIADDWKTPFGKVVDEFARELMTSKTRGKHHARWRDQRSCPRIARRARDCDHSLSEMLVAHGSRRLRRTIFAFVWIYVAVFV